MSNFFYPNQPSIHDPRRYHPGPDIRSYSPSHMYPSSLKASPQFVDNRPIQGYGGYADPMGYDRRRDISPMRYAPMEGARPYEYRNIPLQEPSLPQIDLQESRNMGYGSPIRNKELSPLIRLTKASEGSPVMYRNYLEGANSWDKLIRRPEESKIERFHKMENWKKELDVQLQEQKVKKQVEEEEKRNKELKDENRYKKQLQELMVKNHKEFELRKMREHGHKKNHGGGAGGEKPFKVQHYDHHGHGQNYYVPPNHNNHHLRPDYYLPAGYDEKRGKSLQKHGHHSMEIDDDNRPRQRINGFIDNLKAEILHGQKVFMDGIKDVKYNHKKPNQFRNLAERNLLGAQNGGIVRGGAYLKADYHHMTPEESFGGSLESDRRYRKYDSYDVYQQPVDQYKEDADQFFAQLTHFGHANEKSKIKKGGRPSAKNLQAPEINVNGSELKTTVSDKEKVKKQQVKPQQPEIKEFKIVKETHLKVEDKTIKKVSSEVKIKVENEIPIVKEEKPIVVIKDEKPAIVEKPPVQEEKRKESEDLKKVDLVVEEIEEEVKKPVESKEEITQSKSEFEESTKINQNIAKEMNLKQASPRPEEVVEKLKKTTQGSASTMKPVVPEIPTSLAQLERGETPPMGSMMNIAIPNNQRRENTPLENRKIKNFNLFKNSRRGSVETVDLDVFEDLLEKEVKRGKMPTFKSPREETEVLFGGFDVGKKGDNLKSKRPKKSIVNIKSGVTLRALAQVISNDEVELKHFQQKKADPMAKLDSMLDRLFG